MSKVGIIEQYSLAVMWSTVTLTLIGNDFPPLRPDAGREIVYAVFASILAYGLAIMTITNLTSLFVYSHRSKRVHELKVDKYLTMFKELDVNPNIKFKVHEHLTQQYALEDHSEYQSLIKELPLQWNGIINMEIFLPFIAKIPFLEPFIDLEPGLMIDICKRIEILALAPNSLIFNQGIKGIYHIEKGIVAIEGTVYVRGDVFGETVLRVRNKINEGRAITNVILQFLPKESLENALSKHRKLRYYARRWTSWELSRRYVKTYSRLYVLATIRGALMTPKLESRRGNMEGTEYDEVDLAVIDHMEDVGFF